MTKILSVVLLNIVLAPLCFAGSEQIPINQTITLIQAYDTFVFIHFTPGYPISQGCTEAYSRGQLVIDTSNDLGRNMYSAALSAATAQKTVGFGVLGCHIERPKAYRIDIKFEN